MIDVHDFEAIAIDGTPQRLADYRGKVLLILNTASKCGFTPQFEGLEKLYSRYRDRGLEILGFPCNQFGHQDPGSESEIAEFCQRNYGVSFPMYAKIDVNGDNAHPLFEHLKQAAPGVLGSKAIKWNFTKFLVGRDGTVLERFAPATAPEKISDAIERALG